MRFKKVLLTLLLGPLIPIIGVPDDVGAGANDESKGEENNNGDSSNNKDESKQEEVKLFSQTDLDKILGKRIAKERNKFKEELEAEKKKADMTESEKLKAEKEQALKAADERSQKADKRLINAEIKYISAKLNIIDPDAAAKLIDLTDIEVDENGDVKGVEKALKLLIKEKQYLVGGKPPKKGGDDQNNSNNSGSSNNVSMNQLIRRAAGYGE